MVRWNFVFRNYTKFLKLERESRRRVIGGEFRKFGVKTKNEIFRWRPLKTFLFSSEGR